MIRLDTLKEALLAQNPAPGAPPVPAPAPAEPGFVERITDAVTGAIWEMVDGAAQLIPDLIAALLVFLIGYVIAKIIQKLIVVIGKKLHADDMASKIGIKKMFSSAGVNRDFTEVLARLVFFAMMVFFLKVAADQTGLAVIRDPMEGIMTFLPKVITATIIAMAGYLIADLVRNIVAQNCERMGLEYGGALSKLLFSFIFIVVLIVAIGALGVDTNLIRRTVEIALAALALALGLALGLGLKPLAQAIVSGVYAREGYKSGTAIEIDGKTGTVVGVGPVTTRVEFEDGSFASIPNTKLVGEVIKGKHP